MNNHLKKSLLEQNVIDKHFMQLALDLAKLAGQAGEVPVGAIAS